jgi:spermidine/putrescine transport system ATP-binding protein
MVGADVTGIVVPARGDAPADRALSQLTQADARQNVVALAGVVKRFGTVTAVERLDLQIGRGEFFSMLGPSGCGKTTTLRIIGGFEIPTEGTVYLDGRDVTELPAYRRDVNTVFQSYGLFPHLNVHDNVAFGLRRKKVPAKEIERRVGEVLELVGLPRFGKRRPSQLSGGQQQRVALARALVNHPQLLLLDEPLGALDLKLRKQMQLELKRIQREVGITFVFVTHDQEEAMTISDRLAVMSDGRIEQLGRPEDVYDRPATPFVAEFLGASNLLEGTCRSDDGRWSVIELATGEIVRAPSSVGWRPGDKVRVGMRPEKIRVSHEASPSDAGWNSLRATLSAAVFVGVSYQYFFECAGGGNMTSFASNSGSGPVAAPGQAVRLEWLPEHTFVMPSGAADEARTDQVKEN